CFAVFLAFSFLQVALADDSSQNIPSNEEFTKELSLMGMSYQKNGNQFDIEINQYKALDAIPLMQKLGGMNADVTQADINQSQVFFSGMVGLFFTVAILQKEYMSTDLDAAHFDTYLNYSDDYGNPKKEKIYSFDFDKSLFK